MLSVQNLLSVQNMAQTLLVKKTVHTGSIVVEKFDDQNPTGSVTFTTESDITRAMRFGFGITSRTQKTSTYTVWLQVAVQIITKEVDDKDISKKTAKNLLPQIELIRERVLNPSPKTGIVGLVHRIISYLPGFSTPSKPNPAISAELTQLIEKLRNY